MNNFAKGALLYAVVPPEPYRVAAATVRERLAEHGVELTPRSVQRHLVQLAKAGLVQTDGRNPARWWRA